jgi:hypothetical protein
MTYLRVSSICVLEGIRPKYIVTVTMVALVLVARRLTNEFREKEDDTHIPWSSSRLPNVSLMFSKT